ncbi:MAG: cysteine hydrolase [Plectolyngbya sp. WJT66-NPBG17]|jgi:nicotinamidase-related amidase|nr:cysteine hydrolase [Plectolyngbya sp. WJT66-NPBG17]MBW4527350.1 cysteine hydrolase [Phormidium tanganyikae FI6-MK23]
MNSHRLIQTRRHAFPIDLDHTALLVIDLQNDFCHTDGFCSHRLGADISNVRNIIPRIQKVIDWARQHGMLVIYTRESHKPDLSDATPCKQLRYENAGYPLGTLGKMGRFLIQGDRGCELIDELQPLETELQIDKPAQSAFIGTNLEAGLRQRNTTHLLFTGVTTECCVLGSYRHASDLGFYGLLLEDCCAAYQIQEHQSAIEVLLGENGAIGWVTTSEQVLTAI